MSAKAVSEATGKRLLAKHLTKELRNHVHINFAEVDAKSDLDALGSEHAWLKDKVRTDRRDYVVGLWQWAPS